MDATLREEVLVKIIHDRCLFLTCVFFLQVTRFLRWALGLEGNEC
jgi:hypothetical protein